MPGYDRWKTRDDRPEDELEPEQMTEKEYAVYEAEQAFNVLVEQWGATRAKQFMMAIFLKHGMDDLKARAARPGVKEQL